MPLPGALEAAERMANPALVEMWRNNLRKSQRSPTAARRQTETSATINIVFDGGNAAPVIGLAGLFELTFPCRILGCHIYAGDANLQPQLVTATIDLQLSQSGFWAEGGSPLYGSGVQPSISAAAEADVSIVGWIADLEPGDLIAYSLQTITAGDATWVTLTLPIRRLDVTSTSTTTVVDSFSDEVTTTDGDTIVLRS